MTAQEAAEDEKIAADVKSALGSKDNGKSRAGIGQTAIVLLALQNY